ADHPGLAGERGHQPSATPRQADYAFTVLARVVSWAFDRGLVLANPLERAGRLYRGTRADKIWTVDDEVALLAKASPELRLAFIFALYTGQRQGDLLRLPWSAYDGERVRLRQNKTGARVSIPVHSTLRQALETAPRCSPVILTNSAGRPWTSAGFSSSWRKLVKRAGIEGLTFNDIRGTAVTRLALAGCDHALISAITGHTMGQVGAILDHHYISRTAILADEAIANLEAN
ncbi:MAG: tyrosine-type recombinase/integrase, partial [Alphaproteobacteria bacterium]|nr:tyrosine-type recombinase/integrase [Alphaproteobacteria bacterium]